MVKYLLFVILLVANAYWALTLNGASSGERWEYVGTGTLIIACAFGAIWLLKQQFRRVKGGVNNIRAIINAEKEKNE